MSKIKNKLARLRRKKSGFTLVEILISTTLMLVVMLVTSTIFFNTMGTSNHAVRRNERKLSADEIYIAITNRLSGATYVALQDAGTALSDLKYENYIHITENQVEFGTKTYGPELTVTPAGLNDGKMKLITKNVGLDVMDIELSIKDEGRKEGYFVKSSMEIYNIHQKNKLKVKRPPHAAINSFGIIDATTDSLSGEDRYTNIMISYEGGTGLIVDETYGDGLYTVDQQYKDPNPPASYPTFPDGLPYEPGDYVIGPDGDLYIAKDPVNADIYSPGRPDDFGQSWKRVENDIYSDPSYYVPGDVIVGSDHNFYMCFSPIFAKTWDPATQNAYFRQVYWCQKAADLYEDKYISAPGNLASAMVNGVLTEETVSGRAYGWSLVPSEPFRKVKDGKYESAWVLCVPGSGTEPADLQLLDVLADEEHMITNKDQVEDMI